MSSSPVGMAEQEDRAGEMEKTKGTVRSVCILAVPVMF